MGLAWQIVVTLDDQNGERLTEKVPARGDLNALQIERISMDGYWYRRTGTGGVWYPPHRVAKVEVESMVV